jgi:hypothetical protein
VDSWALAGIASNPSPRTSIHFAFINFSSSEGNP